MTCPKYRSQPWRSQDLIPLRALTSLGRGSLEEGRAGRPGHLRRGGQGREVQTRGLKAGRQRVSERVSFLLRRSPPPAVALVHPSCDGDLITQVPLAGPLLPREMRKRPKPVP